MRADPELGPQERLAVVAALREKFSLADELSRLVELAEQTARTASDFHQFTSVINDGFSQEQKYASSSTCGRSPIWEGISTRMKTT